MRGTMLIVHLNSSRFLHSSLGETLADITASFAAAGFEIRDDRSIHDPQSITFLRDIVGAETGL